MHRVYASARNLCVWGSVFSVWILCLAPLCEGKSLATAQKPPIDFNRDIRPIFAENCYACHGPDKNKRKAGLRLDRQEEAFAKLESGAFAIVPGDVSKSELLKRIVSTDDDE